MPAAQTVSYTRTCISCLNKVQLVVQMPNTLSQAPCPICTAFVRIWR